MDLQAYVTHRIPGRLRLKIPAAKGRPDLLEQVAAAARSANDIKKVEYNPVTGSVLIHHSPGAYRSLEALGSILGDSNPRVSVHTRRPPNRGRSAGARSSGRTGPSVAAKAITSFFKNVDREIREATDNEIDLKVLLPLTAGILGFFASRRKAATPLWLTLMIFAFHSFLTLHGAAAEEMDELTISTANGAPSE